ncbi:MAG: DUF3343 domain-containing protein [Defluviitaleaceae bacterium]|nr:DUF3343 domain-containing protein [Defluviitaleaceae bacterium]
MDTYKLFTFNSTHQAMLSEKTLKGAGLLVRLIPVPRSVSASCGLALRVSEGEYEGAVRIMEENGIEIAEIHDF